MKVKWLILVPLLNPEKIIHLFYVSILTKAENDSRIEIDTKMLINYTNIVELISKILKFENVFEETIYFKVIINLFLNIIRLKLYGCYAILRLDLKKKMSISYLSHNLKSFKA